MFSMKLQGGRRISGNNIDKVCAAAVGYKRSNKAEGYRRKVCKDSDGPGTKHKKTQRTTTSCDGGAGERAEERAGERASAKASKKASERANERANERVSERARINGKEIISLFLF